MNIGSYITQADGTRKYVLIQTDEGSQIQSDYTETDSLSPSYIQNKPADIIPSASALGIVGDGTDQTSALQAIINVSKYAGIIIDVPAITVSGALNCNGKILKFVGGCKIIGVGTINQATTDVLWQYQAYASTITLTGALSAWPFTSIHLFGALGNGSTDDIIPMQKVSDTVIANNTLPRLLILTGKTFKISSPWLLYQWNGTDYQQFNIHILGTASGVNSNLLACTKIDATSFSNTFALGVQIGYGAIIDGLYIQGASNIAGVTYDSFVSNPYSTYSSTRDSRFSPYTGICDMPFTNYGSDIPADGGYPGFNASASVNWYRGSGSHRQSGSTGLIIRNCVVQGFTVDICQAPNGTTQQGEDMVIENCELHYAKSAIALCQTQTDNASIDLIKSWYYLWTIVDGTSYGAQQGYVPNIKRINIAAFVKQAFSLSSVKSVLIEKIYAESLFQIGTVSSIAMSKMIACDFNFALSTQTYQQPQTHFTAQNVSVSGGSIRYYDDLFNKRMRISPKNVVFDSVGLDAPPMIVNQDATQQPNIRYVNCPLGNNVILGMNSDLVSISTTRFTAVLYGKFNLKNGYGLDEYSATGGNTVFPDITMAYDCANFNRVVQSFASSQTITPDSTRTATFTSSNAALAQVNDYCTDNSTGSIIGRISVISGTTITITEIPQNITTGTISTINLVYYLTIACPLVGDIAAGQPTISNVCQIFPGFANTVAAGVRFDHPAFPKGTYVVSIAGNIITMSANSNVTAVKQNFLNGEPAVTVKCVVAPSHTYLATYATPFPAGTVWYVVVTSIGTSTTQPDKYVFNQGGYVNSSFGGAYLADYYLEGRYAVIGGALQWFNNTTGTWGAI